MLGLKLNHVSKRGHWCHPMHNTVNFLWNAHKRHSIACLWGWDMGCLLWVKWLDNVLLLSMHHSLWYHDIFRFNGSWLCQAFHCAGGNFNNLIKGLIVIYLKPWRLELGSLNYQITSKCACMKNMHLSSIAAETLLRSLSYLMGVTTANCGDTCQIWTWYFCFDNIEKLGE